jgi:F0F1-type ATP synthase assembly protein I
MGKGENDMNKDQKQHDESLKGTFASVMLVGAFIAVTWVGVYVLFIARG